MYNTSENNCKFHPVPSAVRDGIVNGTHDLFGSFIKHGERIVGYMQETSLASQLFKIAATDTTQRVSIKGAGYRTATADDAFHVAMRTIEELKVGELLVGTSSIGISAAEFDVVSLKILGLERRIRARRQSLRSSGMTMELFRLERVAEGMTLLRSIAEQFEQGWSLSNPLSQWSCTANEAHILVDRFEELFNDTIEERSFSLFMLELLADALALASSVRVKSRLAAGQDHAGEEAAGRGSTAFIRMEERLTVDGPLLNVSAAAMRYINDVIKHHRNAAISTLYMIEELLQQNISGQALLAAARTEANTPIIFLPTR